jgi:hypothetical protein
LFARDENRAVVTLASTLSDQAMILSNTIHKIMKSKPEKFQEFLNIPFNESLSDSVVETMQAVFYHGISVWYARYLKFLYANLQCQQRSSNQWPPSATHKFFRLAMIKGEVIKPHGHIDDNFLRMTITGKIDDILHQKYPVELKNIFELTAGKRKVILLLGVERAPSPCTSANNGRKGSII